MFFRLFTMNVAIIGYGYWGSKLARNFQNSSFFDIVNIADKKNKNLTVAKKILPSAECFFDYKKAINIFSRTQSVF